MLRLPSPLALCLALALSACGANSGDPTKVSYASALGVDLGAMNRSASGLYTQDLSVGTGTEATAGRTLNVYYSGWLPDGELFDSNAGTGRPFSFVLGQGRVIAGWDEGLVGMRVGGKRKLVIPSDLAYGESGNGAIPANSVLVFDVELASAR